METMLKVNGDLFYGSVYVLKEQLVIKKRKGIFQTVTIKFSINDIKEATIQSFFGTHQLIFNYDKKQIVLYTQSEGLLSYLQQKCVF